MASPVKKALKTQPVRKPSVYLPTGSTLGDIAIGGGLGKGFETGDIVNIVGDKSTGKTFMAMELLGACINMYGSRFKWNYDDAENGNTFSGSIWGFDVSSGGGYGQRCSRTVQELYSNVRHFCDSLEEDEMGVYVLDSLDGLISEETEKRGDERYKAHEASKEYKQGTYQMEKPKFLSAEFFPDIADRLEAANVLLIVISQVRDNVDPFSFKKHTRGGGKALDFYCHTIIWLANKCKLMRTVKGDDLVYGIVVTAKLDKSKTPRPFRVWDAVYLFDYGLDDVGSNVDYLYKCRGKDGKLLEAAKRCVWGDSISDALFETIIEWELEDEFAETYPNPTEIDYEMFLMEYEGGDKIVAAAKSAVKNTGVEFTRDALVSYIEDNDLEKELKKKVEDTWERKEAAVKSNRKPKY